MRLFGVKWGSLGISRYHYMSLMRYYNSSGLSGGDIRLNGTPLGSMELSRDQWRSIGSQLGSLGFSGSN